METQCSKWTIQPIRPKKILLLSIDGQASRQQSNNTKLDECHTPSKSHDTFKKSTVGGFP